MAYLLVAQTAPLQERILLAAIGPLITVVLGGLVVWGITTTIERRREAADRALQHAREDRIRAQDIFRADDALRHELVTSMIEAAGALKLAEENYWRAQRGREDETTGKVTTEDIQMLRAVLDAQFLKTRADGDVIENRLEVFFVSDEPKRRWHETIDLLAARYFLLVERDEAALRVLAGPDHTNLSVDELRNTSQVLRKYNEAWKACVRSIYDGDLRARYEANG